MRPAAISIDVLDHVTYEPSKGGYVIALDKAVLKDAPNYTAEELRAFGGRDVPYREALFKYYAPYGVAPYW